MEKKSTLPPNRFSSFTKKRLGLVLVIIIALFISNELFFRWAKPLGVSENDIYDLSGLWVDRPSGYGKTLPISVIAFDSLNNLWVGRKADVTVIRPDGSSRTYDVGEESELRALAVDSHDQVWIGGGFGLRKLAQQGTWIPVWDNHLTGNYVYALTADQQGRLWVATKGNLSKYSDGKWTHFPADYPKASAVDQQERVWSIKGKKTIGFFSSDGSWEEVFPPRYGEIYSLAIDAHGRVWARIQEQNYGRIGLSVCEENTRECSVYYRNISAALPLGYTMAFDNDNRLWVPHSTGVRVIDVNRVLSVSVLNGLLIFRLGLSVLFFLIGYFLIVRLSDTRKQKTIPEYLTAGDVLKRVWLTLVLVGLVGPVLLFYTGAFYFYNDTHRNVLWAIIVITGALVPLIRARSLMVNSHISKESVVSSTVWGGLITFVCTIPIFIAYLLLRSLGQ